jgi:pyruvate, water dikinase
MNTLWFSKCNYNNKNMVGGKNASLGELYHLSKKYNFNISNGYCTTTKLYLDFVNQNDMQNLIEEYVSSVNIDNIEELNNVSNKIKNLFKLSTFKKEQIDDIKFKYEKMIRDNGKISFAIRSSSVAEDLPNASFAGQHDTYLNVNGFDNILKSIKNCFGSLFNSRAISYRHTHNIAFEDVLISVGIQKMIRSDIGSAGVAFSIDPETGYNNSVIINSSYGLGEIVVSGEVKPDEIIVDKRLVFINNCDPIITKKIGYKDTMITISKSNNVKKVDTTEYQQKMFSIDDSDSILLSKIVCLLEKEYCKLFKKKLAVDVEWAIDGIDKKIYIIQTRPETVHSNNKYNKLITYNCYIGDKIPLITGVSVGDKVSDGKINILKDISEYKKFKKGQILVTDMTTPDWEPIMKISSGIITNKGGRTCHAAIVAREMGINAIVGTINATYSILNNQHVTMVCSNGEVGSIYNGKLDYDKDEIEINTNKKLPIKLKLNVGSPENAFHSSLIPNNSGVGLARMEFIITNYIKIHPLALLEYPNVRDDIKNKIEKTIGSFYGSGREYFIYQLSKGLSKIASAFYPKEVIVRLSDFKTNEYRNLIGGELYEPQEENPMIGWRGASRYYSDEYKKGFQLECESINYVRNNMKLNNLMIMIPFCRTPNECKKVCNLLQENNLIRGQNNLKYYLMCEIPSNVIEADNFQEYIDGVSIGGNDLLQLTLGVDRDSEMITKLTDDKNISYRRMISMAIKEYHKFNKTVGFCGQQPSDSIEFCKFLINEGIDSISITPDSAIKTIQSIAITPD